MNSRRSKGLPQMVRAGTHITRLWDRAATSPAPVRGPAEYRSEEPDGGGTNR